MPISLPLQAMSIAEKLQVMETIWDDLRAGKRTSYSPPLGTAK